MSGYNFYMFFAICAWIQIWTVFTYHSTAFILLISISVCCTICQCFIVGAYSGSYSQTGKVFLCIFQAKLLGFCTGKFLFGFVRRVKAEDIVVILDVVVSQILMEFLIDHFAFFVKKHRIAVEKAL